MPPRRQPIYLAADPIEAEIVRNLFAAEHIECDVLGALLWSGRGELAADAYPRLLLRDPRDEARARELLAEYALQSTAPAASWTCACGEPVPANFAVCWSCGGAN